MAKRWGKRGSSDRFPLVLSNHCGWWLQSWNQKPFAFWKESYDKPRQCAENQRQYSAIKVHIVKAMIFPSGNVQLWELDRKEGKAPKNWCLQTMVLESPLNGKEIKSVNLKGNQPWILTGRADAEVEALVFWSSDMKSWLTGKVPDAGKDWGQKKKRASEDKMARQHCQCNGHELGQTLGDGEEKRGLACCSPWGHKVWHNWTTEQQCSINIYWVSNTWQALLSRH